MDRANVQLSLFWSYSAFVKYYGIYGVEKWHGLFLPMQPFTRLVMVWGLVLEYIVCIHSCLISSSRHLFMIKYIGGFQLVDLIITELKNHMTC